MRSKWPAQRISEFAKAKGGKRLPAGTSLVPERTTHPYLRIVDFRDGGIDQSALQYVPDDVFPRISRYTITERDVYISIVGTIGLVGQVPRSLSGANLTENAAKITEIQPHVLPEFLCYFLQSADGQREIRSRAVGSTQPKLALYRIEEIPVPVAPLDEQIKVVAIIRALDDRIESLRLTNAALEAIAQALFKSWFVDFDPVRAKAEGREPESMDADTAALFPSELEDSELGSIPKGWTAGRLADVVELKYGKSLRAADRNNGEIPVYGSGGVTGFHDKPLIEGPTVIVGRKGTVGSIYWESLACFPIDTVFYVEPKRSLHFAYFALQRAGLDGLNTDAAVPGLNRNNAYRQPVVIPPPELIHAWDVFAGALRSRIDTSQVHAANLSQLRDALLPRLISGKLRLPEAEREIEAATA